MFENQVDEDDQPSLFDIYPDAPSSHTIPISPPSGDADETENAVIISINPLTEDQVEKLPEGSGIVSFIYKYQYPQRLDSMIQQRSTVCAIESVPRTTAAQYMDALTSTAKVAGYRSVIEAVQLLGRFPMQTATAAQPIKPITVFVIGVGVAGLEAISTARALGANVKAFDPRPAVRDQVISLGAEFIEMGIEVSETGGYAKELEEDFLLREQELIALEMRDVNVVVTSAAIPGKPAPLLITEDALQGMPSGAVIVDLAAGSGGNCMGTVPDETVDVGRNILVIGDTNIARRMPSQASELYSANVVAILKAFGDDPPGDVCLFNMDPCNPVIGRMIIVKKGCPVEHPPLPLAPAQEESKVETVEPPLVKRRYLSPDALFFLIIALLLGALSGLAVATPRTAGGLDFLRQFLLFVLSVIAGVYVTLGVVVGLQSPLMSLTNAITGLVLVGGFIVLSRAADPWSLVGLLASFAILLLAVNLVGGFEVTRRMLGFFRAPDTDSQRTTEPC
ncbi:hypothetical protein P9112_003895 [Eukaryota sp. TZLM1-RC]